MSTLNPALRDQMLAAVPSLRAFAISLSGNVDRADDLVQEALTRAIANIIRFSPAPICPHGCSRSCATCFVPSTAAPPRGGGHRRLVRRSLKSHPEQNSDLEFKEFRAALDKLPARAARGSGADRRVGFLVRGSGGDLRMRRRHDQEPG